MLKDLLSFKNNYFYLSLFIIFIFFLYASNSYRFIYDGHHHGLVFSNALDILNDKKPYKEIFIQYGLITTFLHSLVIKIFGYKIIKPKPLIFKNKIVSSTFIRKLLSKGNLNYANKLLRRNWSIQGSVQKGRQVGKKIGFPTCNLDIKNYVIPKLGVYAVKIRRKNTNKILKGIANLGYRPTFNQKKILLEVFIFNFSSNLYNKVLIIDFISFIRNEKKFKNIIQLKKQISSDLVKAKKKLN